MLSAQCKNGELFFCVVFKPVVKCSVVLCFILAALITYADHFGDLMQNQIPHVDLG